MANSDRQILYSGPAALGTAVLVGWRVMNRGVKQLVARRMEILN